MREPRKPSGPDLAGTDVHLDAQAIFESELRKLAAAPKAHRIEQLGRSALALGQLLGGELDREIVQEALCGRALALGLNPGHVRATIQSGIEAGMAQRQTVPEDDAPGGDPLADRGDQPGPAAEDTAALPPTPPPDFGPPPAEPPPPKPPAKPSPSARRASKPEADDDQGIPPHDQSAEEAVIGAILGRPDECLPAVRPLLIPESFWREPHRNLFAAILQVADEGGTLCPATVAAAMVRDPELPEAAAREYLDRLFFDWGEAGGGITGIEASRFAQKIANSARRRRLAELGEKLTKEALAGKDTAATEAAITEVRTEETDTVPFVWGDELVAKIETVRWLWPGWLPVGFTTLAAGDPGVYKSATALWIAAQLGCAGKWPDGTPMDRVVKTCWLDCEGMQAANADRLRLWGFDPSCIMWMGEEGLDIPAIGRPGELARYVRTATKEGCGFVVLDCLRTAHPKEEKGPEIAALMAELALVARTYQIALLVLHHPRKRSTFETARLTLDRVRGGSEIGASARVVWGIWIPDPKPAPAIAEARVEVIKSNLGQPPEPWGVRWPKDQQLDFIKAPEEHREPTLVERAEDWLKALLQKGPVAVRVIEEKARAAGFSESTLKRARWSLKLVTVNVKLRDDNRREMDVAGWGLPITDDKA